MSIAGILAVSSVLGLVVAGIAMGVKGALTDAPPYMQGQGATTPRFADGLKKAA